MSSNLNPRTTHYEFLGPPGAFAISIGVPIATYLLYFGCSESAGGCPPKLDLAPERVLNAVTNLDWWKGLWDTEASLIYFAWYAFCVVAWAVLPGDQVAGTTLRTGGKKQYKINGTSPIPTVLKQMLIHAPFSVLYIFVGFGSHLGHHPTFWARIFHLYLRQMGWLRYRVTHQLLRSGNLLLYHLLQKGEAPSHWGELWKFYI